MRRRTERSAMLAVLLFVSLLLSGCAGVTVSSVSPSKYLSERRGDVLTTGRLSETAQEVLRVAGIADCREEPVACRDAVGISDGISDEQRLSALSELWIQAALTADNAPSQEHAAFNAWLEAARHAYAYLFFTARRPGERAFEDRQTQVRDYYNYAAQQVMTQHFKTIRANGNVPRPRAHDGAPFAGWQISSRIDDLGLPANVPLPDELLAASSLKFIGLRNTYRRDGFGAELVAVMPPRPRPQPGPSPAPPQPPFDETRFPAISALLRFGGNSLPEVLATRSVQMVLFDPYRSAQVQLAGEHVPLAANFTAGYGLWLARSGFATQSLRTLFGLANGIVSPRIELMQPYDPKRRTIVMLHGLASSPEAWINMANELLGDEQLRRNYQIWQVYYPTNAPLALNQKAIRDALTQTLAQLDPNGTAQASKDIVLVGHSMGGVLARLLVSSSGEDLWSALPPLPESAEPSNTARVRERLAPYLRFEPLPQVTRAVFIATPHRGTPVAASQMVRRLANLVTLPLSMMEEIGDITSHLTRPGPDGATQRIPNSIDNLRDSDTFVRTAATLPISPRVRYHSIIGKADLSLPLTKSSDGIVPYASAHLAGAASERVFASGHSVQENPLAILEIRRILLEQLK